MSCTADGMAYYKTLNLMKFLGKNRPIPVPIHAIDGKTLIMAEVMLNGDDGIEIRSRGIFMGLFDELEYEFQKEEIGNACKKLLDCYLKQVEELNQK